MRIRDSKSKRGLVQLFRGICACVFVPTLAAAQVSATWTGLGDTSDFSDPYNWSSFPNVPGGGGAVAFDGPGHAQDIAISGNSVAVSRWTNEGTLGARNEGTGSMIFVGPAEVHTNHGPIGSPTLFRTSDTLDVPVHGTAGLTKTGPGVLSLGQGNPYTGGTRVFGGWLVAERADSLGVPGSTIYLNGGGINVRSDHSSQPIELGSLGGSIIPFVSSEIGHVSGPGDLTIRRQNTTSSSTELRLVAPGTHTGKTILLQSMELRASSDGSSHGRLTATQRIDVLHSLFVGNGVTAPPSDCINDVATMAMLGGSVAFNPSGAGLETIGTLRLESGRSSTNGSFRAQSLQRQPGAVLRVVSGQPQFTIAPTLVGSGMSGTPTVGLLPYVLSSTAAPVTFENNAIRPIASTEQLTPAQLPSPHSPDVNLRTGSNEEISVPVSVRSLHATGAFLSGATITINGGGVYASLANTISNPIHFGDSEGFIHTLGASPAVFIDGVVTGTGGVTTTGGVSFSGANTYTGATNSAGRLEVVGDVLLGQPSPLGLDVSPVVLQPQTGAPTLILNGAGAIRFERPLIFADRGQRESKLEFGESTTLATISGDIEINNVLTPGNTSISASLLLSGRVTGPGSLRVFDRDPITLLGENNYSGGTDLTGPVRIGSDSALGNGPVWVAITNTSWMPGLEAIDAPRQLSNELIFFGARPLRFSGTQPLTFTSTARGYNVATINLMAEAPLTLAGGYVDHVLSTTGAGTLQLGWYRGRGIDARAARIVMLPGESALSSRAGTLNIATTAVVDLNDHTLILDRGGGTITGGEAGILGFLSSGRLISTVATDTPGTGIGYALVSDALGTQTGDPPAMYAGQLVREHDLIIRYTLLGDANLDEIVNINDFARLAANFNVAGAFWSGGNFNHDGVTNIADFALMAANFNQSLPLSRSAVPEPFGIFGIIPLVVVGRRGWSRVLRS